MGLIKCPECGQRFENDQPCCPYCGAPLKGEMFKQEEIIGEKATEPESEQVKNQTANDEDKLSKFWYAVIIGSIFIPVAGAWIIIITSSFLYYHWRKEYPKKAKEINQLGWAAWVLGHIVGCLIISLMNEFK
ncbi:MAG: zinc ribbon domain-containing protein [bacterium]|nr:zinc ribbon domain-containing protein [bacterium]